ncbi:hypothetical protein GC197_12505 [bacterium]|nr:hypothetical protein [bacterium]
MPPTLFAVWLVIRSNVWNRWQGWLRAGIYVLAFAYGQMLHEWVEVMNRSEANFYVPGMSFYDFYRPAIVLLIVLIWVWLLTPLAMLCSIELSTERDPATVSRRFSVLWLIGFVTAAAVILGSIQFLLTTEEQQEGPFMMLLQLPDLVAVMLILFALSKRWWWIILTLPTALVLGQLARMLIGYVVERVSGESAIGDFVDYRIVRCLYGLGPMVAISIALCVARVLGVRPYWARRKEEVVES